MNAITTKLVEFERKNQIVPKTIGACAAISAAALSVFAEGESSSGVDISSITSAMTTSLTDLVSKVALACAGVVGVGLTIFGIKWCVRTVKSFFSKIAG